MEKSLCITSDQAEPIRRLFMAGSTPTNGEDKGLDVFLPPLEDLAEFKKEHPELYKFIVENNTEKLRLKRLEKENELEREQQTWAAKNEIAQRKIKILEIQAQTQAKQALINSYTTSIALAGLFLLLGVSIFFGDAKQTATIAGLLGGLVALAKLYSRKN
jgi:Pyruvate/2-oxoacid:ferredoxin oxidoreductase gamma subunit